MANFLQKLLTLGEGKQVRVYEGRVVRINEIEDGIKALSDSELQRKTIEFRERIERGESLAELQIEAFAVTREASVRALGMRHFDVQLIGGMVLNDGQIAEMKTGEGKTLVSTLAGYLNALPGNGVHVVTVNDYLAKRDSDWMGRIYRFLGMDVGWIQSQMDPATRIPSYQADVTYGTNAEFGFDYLRDNMVTRPEDRVQRGHAYAIVDEVDSILIDEARTPLIISGAGTKSAEAYKQFAKAIPRLRPEIDFELDEAKRTIATTEEGLRKAEQALGIENIYADPSGQLVNHLQQALRAEFLFKRDVDYVVKDGEVLIVDEFTGRLMIGRRYSEGLHQAIEAKERVHVREENQTLATITLQNYFRLYEKLSGMTGTAITEDAEFRDIYKLPVTVVPTNQPMIRDDRNDLIYRTVDAKFSAVADEIVERNENGQPCLVGTISIENSEKLARLLNKRGIKHEVLNAKFHEKEAHIVAQAGRAGAVTIATNMAGRGTDIILGGNPEFLWEDILRGTRHRSRGRRRRAAGRCTRRGEAHLRRRARAGRRGRWPRHSRHRAPRVTAYRQPAAWSCRPPRRPGCLAVLPVARRRPHASVRRRPDGPNQRHDAAHAGARRHAHPGRPREQGDRRRAAPGRVDELRSQKARPRVRRRHEQAARGHLQRAQPHSRRQGHPRARRGDARRDDARSGDGVLPRAHLLRGVGLGRHRAWYFRELTGIDGYVETLRGEVDSPHEIADKLATRALELYARKEDEMGADNLRELERQL